MFRLPFCHVQYKTLKRNFECLIIEELMRFSCRLILGILASCAAEPAGQLESPAAWKAHRSQILANMQLVMGAMPGATRRVPLDIQIHAVQRFPTYVQKTISFAVEPGDRVPALLLVPDRETANGAAVLCLHSTQPLGKKEVAAGGKRPYGAELAERGFVALAPDYPNFGTYKIDVYALGYASTTMKGIWNHQCAIDLLQSLPEVDPERIGVIGHSLGGHNALFLAAFDARVHAVVTSCGFTSFSKYYGGNLNGWSHSGYMPLIGSRYGNDPKRMPFDFPEILALIAPRSVFIHAPLRDDNFDVTGVDDCVSAARRVYALFGDDQRIQVCSQDLPHDFPLEVRVKAYEVLNRELAD